LIESLHLAPLWFVAFLFSTTVHEAAHALVALRLGDPTAYQGGQVTLNPLPHIRREPFGMVVVPILSFALSGWMIGWASAPYDPRWALTYPRRAGWMALAGPASNMILAVIGGLLIRIGIAAGIFAVPASVSFFDLVDPVHQGGIAPAAGALLSIFVSLNALLAAFNLLPFPPLDGSAVLQLLLPESMGRSLQLFLRQPMIGFVGIVIAWNLFGELFSPLFALVLRLLYPDIPYG